MQFDYTAVGHVVIDVLPDGSRQPGGSAFYAALQAARLGQRALIITRGRAREIEQLLDPYRGEFELEILPGRHTTTLETGGTGAARTQRMLAWAGPIGEGLRFETSLLHLAPVAQEMPTGWFGTPDFVGLTPQGLLRTWSREEHEISLSARGAGLPAGRCDAVVISEVERESATQLLSEAAQAGAVVAITAGPEPITVISAGSPVSVEPAAIERSVVEDLGAGDVFAAAFFIALKEGRPPPDAAAFAGAAAALRIGGSGIEAVADRTRIESRLTAAAERAPGEGPRAPR